MTKTEIAKRLREIARHLTSQTREVGDDMGPIMAEFLASEASDSIEDLISKFSTENE